MKLVMLTPKENQTPFSLPLFLEAVSCGFPPLAQDYVEKELDLNDECVCHRSAAYYLRAHGDSMQDGFLFNGDLLVVYSTEKLGNGDIVVAGIDAEFTVKRLQLGQRIALLPMNPAFPPIYLDPDELNIFGVATHIIHRTREVLTEASVKMLRNRLYDAGHPGAW